MWFLGLGAAPPTDDTHHVSNRGGVQHAPTDDTHHVSHRGGVQHGWQSDSSKTLQAPLRTDAMVIVDTPLSHKGGRRSDASNAALQSRWEASARKNLGDELIVDGRDKLDHSNNQSVLTVHPVDSMDEAKRLEVTRGILEKIDELEQEAAVLEGLLDAARGCLEKAISVDGLDDGRSRPLGGVRGQLHVLVVEVAADGSIPASTSRTDASRQQVRVEVGVLAMTQHEPRTKCTSSTTLRPQSNYIAWGETLSLSLPIGEGVKEDDGLRIAIRSEDGTVLSSHTEAIGHLTNQLVSKRWCNTAGWRVHLSLQWIHSRCELLRSHVTEFDKRLHRVRADIVQLCGGLERLVPKHVFEQVI